MHKGIDVFAPQGRDVVSAIPGVVIYQGHLGIGGNVVAVLGRSGRAIRSCFSAKAVLEAPCWLIIRQPERRTPAVGFPQSAARGVQLLSSFDRTMPRYDFELYADCYQFHIQDASADAGQLGWSDEALARQLAVAPGVIGIGTVLNDTVSVSMDFIKASPPLSLECWDHVVECSVSVQSGCILAAGWLGDSPDAVRVEVRPDIYRVRVNYSVLDPNSETGFKEQGRYLLQLWPAPETAAIVLKQGAV